MTIDPSRADQVGPALLAYLQGRLATAGFTRSLAEEVKELVEVMKRRAVAGPPFVSCCCAPFKA